MLTNLTVKMTFMQDPETFDAQLQQFLARCHGFLTCCFQSSRQDHLFKRSTFLTQLLATWLDSFASEYQDYQTRPLYGPEFGDIISISQGELDHIDCLQWVIPRRREWPAVRAELVIEGYLPRYTTVPTANCGANTFDDTRHASSGNDAGHAMTSYVATSQRDSGNINTVRTELIDPELLDPALEDPGDHSITDPHQQLTVRQAVDGTHWVGDFAPCASTAGVVGPFDENLGGLEQGRQRQTVNHEPERLLDAPGNAMSEEERERLFDKPYSWPI